MQIALVFAALVAIAVAAPQVTQEKPAPPHIIQFDQNVDEVGQFALYYRGSDGTTVSRQGQLKPTPDGKDHVLIQSGSQSYTAPDGSIIKLVWTADEDGYHAEGDHLPVAPVVPGAPESIA